MAGNNNGRLTNAIGESLSPAAIKLTVPAGELRDLTGPPAVAIEAVNRMVAGGLYCSIHERHHPYDEQAIRKTMARLTAACAQLSTFNEENRAVAMSNMGGIAAHWLQILQSEECAQRSVWGDADKQCILVIIGADQWGRKELLAIADGYRESAQSWRELLLDLKRRGLEVAPELAVGDGALGFWKALRESHGTTREQRCWLHKTGNVLNKLPKSLQAKAKGHLQDIWLAETKDRAEKAFDFFLEAYGAKYDKATACLAKDRAGLLTFYDFPAEHWKHLRTTNPIESTFATVRLRTIKTKGCLSRTTALTMVFKLCQSAAKKWRRLDGSHRLAEIVEGVKFKDGEKLIERAA